MKVRKKALAVLLCAFVVCLMTFGTLSAASAAAVPTGTVTATDTSAPAVPGLDSIPIVGDIVGGLVDTLTGAGESLPAAPAASLPGMDSLPGLDALIPSGSSNPLQPLLDMIPSGSGGGDLISVLSPILTPLHDGLEMLRDPLTTGLDPLYQALKPIEEPLTQALAPVKDIVQDVVTTLDPVLYPVLHALSPVLCPVLGVLEPVIAELAKVCPNILPPCPKPVTPDDDDDDDNGTPVTPVTPQGNPTTTTGNGTGTSGGVLPFTGANLTAMIVLLMALVGVVVALRRAHLVLKARER